MEALMLAALMARATQLAGQSWALGAAAKIALAVQEAQMALAFGAGFAAPLAWTESAAGALALFAARKKTAAILAMLRFVAVKLRMPAAAGMRLEIQRALALFFRKYLAAGMAVFWQAGKAEFVLMLLAAAPGGESPQQVALALPGLVFRLRVAGLALLELIFWARALPAPAARLRPFPLPALQGILFPGQCGKPLPPFLFSSQQTIAPGLSARPSSASRVSAK